MYKIDKSLSHQELDHHLTSNMPECRIKSLKISRDEKYKSKGYGFVCFESEQEARAALKALDGKAIPWNPTNPREAEKKAKNNIYVKNIPDAWVEKDLQEHFGKFGNISSLVLNSHANGKFAFICF